MNYLIFLTLYLSVTFVICQGPPPLQPTPSAGPGSLVGAILGGRTAENPAPERWVEFVDLDNDWSRLGSCFTVEAWVWHSSQGLSTWQPIVSRHPGWNAPREYSHFYLAVNNGNLEVKIGCGCGENDTDCGYGYSLLATDIPVDRWLHVAVVVDGDDTSVEETTRVASLYILGSLQDSSAWAEDDAVCTGRAVQFARYADVKIGFFDDEVTDDTNQANPNMIYGWWGRIDELRFWQGVRQAEDIDDYSDVGLRGSETGLFAYYQFSPELEVLGDPDAPKEITNKVYDILHGLPQPDPTDPTVFFEDTGLSSRLYSYSTVLGRDGDNLDLPLLPNYVKLEFYPPSEDVTGSFTTESSEALQTLGDEIAIYGNPEDSTEFIVFVNCSGNDCSGYTERWKDFYFEYFVNYQDPTENTRMYLRIETACPSGVYDDCGVCEGDNSQCQCVVYHGFESERMSYILFEWSLNNLIEEVSDALATLSSTKEVLELTTVEDPVLRQQIYDLMNFYNIDLTEYCGDLASFKAELESSVPRAPEALINSGASDGVDGTLPFIPTFVPPPGF